MTSATSLGYQHLIDRLQLSVRPLTLSASISSAVNRRMDTATSILFPRGVAIDNTLVGHLEFALRHEGVNLEVIEAAFLHIPPADLILRLRQSPNGEYIRRACFLWEWMNFEKLEAGVSPEGIYVPLFSPDDYVVAANASRNQTYRVDDNALGTSLFCPTVRRKTMLGQPNLEDLLTDADAIMQETDGGGFYERAIQYLYLSETRSNYAIEHETPTGSKEERFVRLLKRAGEKMNVSEDWLVELQNAIVRDVFSEEASYRNKQNWLEDRNGRITYFPPTPQDMRLAMTGWEGFVNDRKRGVDILTKAACASFGFVYLHPFMDGNGRLHRFMIHQVLAQSGLLPNDMVIPVSAVIMKNIAAYHEVLTSFSKPVRSLWQYKRGDQEPSIISTPASGLYRFFEADREVQFLHKMVAQAILHEIPDEISYLKGYDAAYDAIEREFDLPQKDVSALIKMIQSNGGVLSNNRRRHYAHISEDRLTRLQEIVNDSFGAPPAPSIPSM